MRTVHRAAAVLAAVTALALTAACGAAEDDGAAGAGKPTPAGSAAPRRPPRRRRPRHRRHRHRHRPRHRHRRTGQAATARGRRLPVRNGRADVHRDARGAHDRQLSAEGHQQGVPPCRALGHPVVTFGDLDGAATERGEAPGIEDALLLAPGATAYAGLMGGPDDGGPGTTVGSIAMTMETDSDLEQTPSARRRPVSMSRPTPTP
ncbi:hypothetical protein ACFQ60_38380 [Streptomyces zhihengii]